MILNDLITSYRSDVDSPYHKLRFHTRQHYDNMCKPLSDKFGDKTIAELRARNVLHWHEEYLERGTISMGHSVIGMLRVLAGFGSTILENDECMRLAGMLGNMRFKMPKPRVERLTAQQAINIRAMAHSLGHHSIALSQAFQFELMLRQKDCVGEWVPETEPGESHVFDLDNKWLRGLRWEEIDTKLHLTHITSKRQKEIVVDLKLAPMILAELNIRFGGFSRDTLPATGPIIVSESTGLPWYATEFRRHWRMVATKCGIPRTVFNMDTRAGAISEATDAGAELEHIRHASTHSDVGMVQRYSRGAQEKIAGVMQLRVASRSAS